MSKSKNVVKKLTTILFTLVAVFTIGLTNVNAETTTTDVVDETTLVNAMNDKTTDIVRLTDNIILRDDLDITFYIYKSKTLDLNGHTITVPAIRQIKFWYYADADIKLINSSNSSSAKIIGNHTGASTYSLLKGEIQKDGLKVNFEIDGVDFEVDGSNSVTVVNGINSNRNYESLVIKNSNVNGNQYLFWSGSAKKVYLESITLKADNRSLFRKLSDDSALTVNDVIDANAVVEYYSKDGVKTADRTATLDSFNAYWGPITVKFANGFNVSDATLTGKYGETPETNITIKNMGENDLQIKNVKVSETDKFEIIGATQPTVGAGLTNTDFKIKAKSGINVGTYTATITVEDMDGKTYTATITLKVEKKQLDGLGAGFTSNWTYGETALEPNISGVSSLGLDEYKVEYAKTGTEDWSTIKPTTAGEYTIRLTITGSNYAESSASSTFKILPTEKVVKIVANSSEHQYDGNAYTDNGYKIYFDGAEVTDGKLLNGDIIGNVKINGRVTDVVDNTANNNVIDRNDITITNRDSYKNIEFEDGTIKITPITNPIKVTAKSDNNTYDGNDLTNNGYTYTEGVLLAGDRLEATIEGSQKYVGTSDNKVKEVKVMRDGKDITSNYKFGTHENGTLKVTEASQTVNITENLYVKVGETLTIEKIKELLASDVADYDIKFVSGTAGSFGETAGFTGTATGKVTMEIVVPARDVNDDGTPEYAEAKKTFYINVVDKENVTISGLTDNQEFTYDGTTKTPWGTGTITVEGNKVDVNELEIFYNGTGSTTYSSKFAPVDAGTYTITYKVKDSNPNYVGSVTYAFTIKKAQLNKPSASTTSFVYDGTSKGYSSFHDSETFEFTGTNTATNVGNYSLTISLKDKNNYEWKDGTTTDVVINWSITQATPDYTVPTGLTGVKGNFLSSIELPYGFTWNNASELLTAGTHTYKATYTPEDTTNYKVIDNIDITVVVKNKFVLSGIVNGGNGTISVSSLEVLEGDKAEVVFTPDEGYMIDKVLVEGTEVEVTGNKLELTMDGNKLVTVSYKKIPFTVTVKDVTGATVTPNGAVSVNYGDNKEFTITVNSGYKLVKVLVNGTDKTADMVDDKLTLSNITANMELEVVVEKIVYEVTDGANQKYVITKNNEAKFRINADYSLFDGKVYVDGVLVDSENYTSESGSTIITLKKEFVDTLSIGEHTLKVLFNDGGEAITTFNVAKVTVPTDNPQTGDNIGFYIISGILSIVGLAGAGIFYRRKQTN